MMGLPKKSTMKNFSFIPICLFLSFLFIGCSKDSDCLFVGGKWCDSSVGFLCIEFRENGEYYLLGARVHKWEADGDCKIIEFFDPISGAKSSEATIISITGNSSGSKMIIEEGGSNTSYTKQ